MANILSEEDKKRIRKMQAVLQSIKDKKPMFFNITLYKKWGLVKEAKTHKRDLDYKTNWLLTEKAERILNQVI